MKAKLILSIVSFSMCFILFAALSFAWFTLGEDVLGDNGDFNVISEGTDVDIFHLDGGSWKEGEGNYAEVGLIKPGDVLFFKLTITRKDKNVSKLISLNFLEPFLTITDPISCDGETVYVTDLKGNKIKMYDLENDNGKKVVKINDKILYEYTDKLELRDFLITDSIKVYCSDSLSSGDESEILNLPAYDLDETILVNKDFGNSNIIEVYFAIEINQNEMSIEEIDYSKYYAYQYFKLTGIETVVE